ncbi:MAG: Trm112 family protein [Actinomycetes bacterium]
MPTDPALLAILVCPQCRSTLRDAGDELICTGESCGLAYPVTDGIPVMLVDEARRPGSA